MTDQSKLEQYAQSQQILLDSAQRLQTLFTEMKSDSSQTMETIRNKMKDSSLKVVVLGAFKRGKSTFINSLLGEEILPNFATPCTAVINEVKWGEEKKAVIHFKVPGKKLSLKKVSYADLPDRAKAYLRGQRRGQIEPLEIDINELEDYVVIKNPENDSDDSINDLPYDHVEIFWPLPLLKNGVVVIDSPGLDECESRSEITRRYLDKADVILFVMSCSALAGQTEMSFIDNLLLNNGYEDMIFICNRFDEVQDKERDRVIAFARQKLGAKTALGPDHGIFFLSAATALEGRIQNDSQMVTDSGLTQLEQKLYSVLVESRGRTKLLQPARLIMREAGSVVNKIHTMGTEHLEIKIKLIQRLYDYVQTRNRSIPDIRTALKKFVLDIYHCNTLTKENLEKSFDQFILLSSKAIGNYSPQKRIGLSTFFSDANVRRGKIVDAAMDMYPKLLQIVADNQRNLFNAFSELINNIRKEIRYHLFHFLNQFKTTTVKLDAILHPQKIDYNMKLQELKVAFDHFHAESIAEKNFSPDTSQVDEKSEVIQTEDSANITEVSEIEMRSLLTSLGITQNDFSCAIDQLFPFQAIDYVGAFHWGNAVEILGLYSFDFVDSSKTTNDIKLVLRDHILNQIKEQKNNFILQHTAEWFNVVDTFIRDLYPCFCNVIDLYDMKAEKLYREELLNSERVASFSDSTMKELTQLRSQIEETVFDLVS